ncbi:MAG TPA: DUF4118 domain-containing protein, partial [Anaerolineae bacterium]
LREMALRRAAYHVDDQMRAYMETRAIAGPWAAAERLLVCVSPGALSERLIRAARRLAGELDAEWFALYVETPGSARLPQAQRDRIVKTLRLAEELGARVLTMASGAVAETVLQYARAHNITKIIAGKPVRSRWIELLRGSVVDQIIRQSGNIDVYVISGEGELSPVVQTRDWQPHRPWRRYLIALALVAGATLLGYPVRTVIDPSNLVMSYLLVVVVAAIYLGRGPSVVAAVGGVLAFDFFFIPPAFTFAVANTQYLLTFVGLLTVSLVISNLTVRVREQAEDAQLRESQATELYEFTRALAATSGVADILPAAMKHVSQTFTCEVVILLPAGGTVKPRALSPGLTLGNKELTVAAWAFQHGEAAGRDTPTSPGAAFQYVPLKTSRGVVGVLGMKSPNPDSHLTSDQRRLLSSFANQTAVAIERAQLAEQARQTQLSQATEKLQTALLNSISHDLRTPLVSITGALSSLLDEGTPLDQATRRSLIETASDEAARLNHLVGNLLDMTRVEAGAMRMAQESCDVTDLIGASLDRLPKALEGRRVNLHIPAGLPLVPMDFVLMSQVLVNLLDNALKYSPPTGPIDLEASVDGNDLQISVADRGVGIPPEDLVRVFDKFYRVQRPDGVIGTGLGLAICKGIVEAHGGKIEAKNRGGGGTTVIVSLPLAKEKIA